MRTITALVAVALCVVAVSSAPAPGMLDGFKAMGKLGGSLANPVGRLRRSIASPLGTVMAPLNGAVATVTGAAAPVAGLLSPVKAVGRRSVPGQPQFLGGLLQPLTGLLG